MTQEQRAEFEKALPINNRLDPAQQKIVAKLHAEIFGHKHYTPCNSCSATKKIWFQWVDDLVKKYEE